MPDAPAKALARVAGIAMIGAACIADPAHAQGDRPFRFILPVATASGVDTITRAVVAGAVEGAGRAGRRREPGRRGRHRRHVGAREVAAGRLSTLSIVSNNHVIYPSVLKSVPFDPVADITPIAVIGSTPIVIVVNPKVPAKNAQELIALMKAKPDEINYGSSGNGTILHLAAAMFVDQAGAKAKHIPYKGVGPMLTDLLGGQVDFATASLPSVQQHIKSGALRAIGVGAARRLAAAPDIPTLVEQGMPNYLVEGWFAVIGPPKLPAADVKRINAAFVAAFATPEVREAMDKQGNTINISTPEYAAKWFPDELAKYAAIVKKIGLEPQ